MKNEPPAESCADIASLERAFVILPAVGSALELSLDPCRCRAQRVPNLVHEFSGL